MRMKAVVYRLLVLPLVCVLFSGCNLGNKKTMLEVVDPDRHYYPVLRGQLLDVVYEVKNTGSYPLFIKDIQTSCECISVDESSFKVLPAEGRGFIRLKYDSSKSIGYVKHFITLHANLETSDDFEMTFDLNVVPEMLYTEGYKELYGEYKKKYHNRQSPGDGDNKEYYTEDSSW